MARYQVDLIFSYEVEDVKDKWEALDIAEQMFYEDPHHAYFDYDINPIGENKDDDKKET